MANLELWVALLWISGFTLINLISFWFLQANLQRVHWPAHSGPFTTGKLSTGPHHGARNPRLPDPLQPHHSRLRLSGHLRRHDLTSELPERGAQTGGQDVPELWQRHSGILRQWEQIFWKNGQAQEMRCSQEKPYELENPWVPSPCCPICSFLDFFLKYWLISIVILRAEFVCMLNLYFFEELMMPNQSLLEPLVNAHVLGSQGTKHTLFY